MSAVNDVKIYIETEKKGFQVYVFINRNVCVGARSI
jgi:hypothetical protein